MKKFYTNFYSDRNTVKVRGYNNGRRFQETIDYKPYMFIKKRNDEQSGYFNLKGEPLARIDFESINDARDFIKKYSEVANFDLYGSTYWPYNYIFENYFDVDYDVDDIRIVNFDIEVYATEFPDPYKADWPITAITLKCGKEIVTLGCGIFKNDNPNVKYIRCDNEEDLLQKFLYYWMNFDPDIITGWNIDFFDTPYVINRMKKVCGEADSKRLSPWRKINERTVFMHGEDKLLYDLAGITSLDYMPLYKKFSFSNEESYALDNIAFVTIGEKKMDYSEYDSLGDMYLKDYQKYIEYNIRDVLLVSRMDEKLGFISQVLALAYDSLVNYSDTLASVKIWEIIIINHLMKDGVVVPLKTPNSKDRQIVGGYVKEPVPGLYDWVVSLDLNSLYPHLIMQYNISPEMLRDVIDDLENPTTCVDKILDGYITPERLGILKENNLTLTAGGALYNKEKRGFIPELMERNYNGRVEYKKMMIVEKKRLVEIENEMKKRGLLE